MAKSLFVTIQIQNLNNSEIGEIIDTVEAALEEFEGVIFNYNIQEKQPAPPLQPPPTVE